MDFSFSRRRFLTGAAGSGLALARASRAFAATEFWNAKDPATWTEQEIGILTSKSPWAKSVLPNFRGADHSGTSGRQGRDFRSDAITVIVRWESAQPILDALRVPSVVDFDGHYVLSVTNLPLINLRRPGRGAGAVNQGDTSHDDALDRLQNGATLQTKGQEATVAGRASRTRIGSFLFGFSKDYLHLGPADRDIVFRLDTGELTLQADFNPKEMNYRGKLAL